ncbi:MAG: glycosyltransferase family 9 protein [Candidatus Hodarchaeota archaeon]
MRKINRILIYRIGNLGDIICAMPAMVAVRQHFPDAWIGLLTNKETKGNPDPEEILKENNFLNEIITYETSRIHKPLYLFELLRKIRSFKIDLFVYLSISKITHKRLIRDWMFFRLGSCKRIVGFKMPKPIKFSLENGVRIPVFPQEIDRLISLLIPLGIDPQKKEFRLPVILKDKQHADRIWNKYKLNEKNNIVAICPGAKFPVKHWPINRFGQVAHILQDQYNAKIILIGGQSDKKAGIEITNNCKNPIINIIGETSYMETAEILRRCNLLIANDCGPVHLAAAVGTKVVGIYSSRDFPGSWHPWGKKHTILRNDSFSCRFCLRTECESMHCINSITVKQVIEACRKYLVKI